MTNYEKLAGIRLTQIEGAAETIAELQAENKRLRTAVLHVKEHYIEDEYEGSQLKSGFDIQIVLAACEPTERKVTQAVGDL